MLRSGINATRRLSLIRQAPLASIRDLREPDASGHTIPEPEVPALLATHLRALLPIMAEKCPETELPDLSGIITD